MRSEPVRSGTGASESSCGMGTLCGASGAIGLSSGARGVGEGAGAVTDEPIGRSAGALGGAGGAGRVEPRSKRVRRSSNASRELSSSGLVRRTIATSRVTILLGALFISRMESPTVSRIRTLRASPN